MKVRGNANYTAAKPAPVTCQTQAKDELAHRTELERRVEEMRAELEVVSRGKLEEAEALLAVEREEREKLAQVCDGVVRPGMEGFQDGAR